MSDSLDLLELPDSFNGRVRLFPLPGLVAFPHVVQPLRIFEPRYCDLLRDALASDQLITLATLAPDWPGDISHTPAIAPTACIGRILLHSASEDHTFNVLLLGVRRCRIVREIPSSQRFRVAEVEVLEDFFPELPIKERQLKAELLDLFSTHVSATLLLQENLRQLADEILPLSAVTDLVSFGADLPQEEKLTLLGEPNVMLRAELLIDRMHALGDSFNCSATGRNPGGFPPPFSMN